MHSARPTLEINLAKILANYRNLVKFCKPAIISAVVKANSYGLGAVRVSRVLNAHGCRDFFVAFLDEGIELRNALPDSNIFVLNGVFHQDVEYLLHYNLIPVLNHLPQVKLWQEVALREGRKLPCILHIDTGMNRFGITDPELEKLLASPEILEALNLQYILSHISASDDHPYNVEQLRVFREHLKFFPGVRASLANSSSIFLGKDYHFDLVRPGAALYGINPSVSKGITPIYNPVKLSAPIIQLKNLKAGSFIGYDMTHSVKRDSVIATLAVGYADGYFRHFSNNGEVFIDGHIAKVVGRVSMDLITVDVTDLPPEKIFLGQKVEIIGDNLEVDKLASIAGTIGYEVLTNLGNRYEKVYIE